MKLSPRYNLIAPFASEAAMQHTEVEVPEVEVPEVEVENLKKLIAYYKIDETYVGELAWYLDKAKRIVKQEQAEKKYIDNLREVLYSPKIANMISLERGEEEINKVWEIFINEEKTLTEQEKIERDRKLYKEITQIMQLSIDLSKAFLTLKGGKTLELETSYFLKQIQDIIRIQGIPQQLGYIINRIGIDDQLKNKPKLSPYQRRVEFAGDLYRFVNFYLTDKENQINSLGAGILYIADFSFPFQENYKDIEPFNFDNIKVNKRYTDYFRDISTNDVFTKLEKNAKRVSAIKGKASIK